MINPFDFLSARDYLFFLTLWTTSLSCFIPLIVLTPCFCCVPSEELLFPPWSALTLANVISPHMGITVICPQRFWLARIILSDWFLQNYLSEALASFEIYLICIVLIFLTALTPSQASNVSKEGPYRPTG